MPHIQLSLLPEIIPEQTTINPVEKIKNRILPDCPIVVSYGGGTNSTALLILARLKSIKIDLILFADTGNEHPYTYEFLEWFDKWLQLPWEFNGKIYPPMPGITVVSKKLGKAGKRNKLENRAKKEFANLPRKKLSLFFIGLYGYLIQQYISLYAVGKTLGEDCLIKNRMPSKAYGMGACSREYKIAPQEEEIKRRYGKKAVIQWIGIHTQETNRLFNKHGIPKPLESNLGYIDYPLIKEGLNQQNCEALCKLLPRFPGKSSCWFCPSLSIARVKQLKEEHPDLYELGCFMESQDAKYCPDNSSIKGLGRSFSWRDIEDYSEQEFLQIDSIKTQMKCACMD